jgi:hypothetical protein
MNAESLAEKALALVFAILVLLSLLACLSFLSISTFSLLIGSLSHYWNGCFLLCSTALVGWMILYAGRARLGGGVMIFLNNLMLFWFLALAVLISALARFSGPQRYVAVLVWCLTLAAFYIAVPIIGPSTLIRLLKGRGAVFPNGRSGKRTSE